VADAPEFAAPKPPPATSRWQTIAPWGIAVVLAATLALQVLVADRVRLAADPAWRPRIVALCAALHCSVPEWREPAAFHVTAREVRPHPTAAGVLLVSATFRNDARFAQPWPRLQLALANPEGEALGLRRFKPAEYLGGAPASPRIGAVQSATIALAVVDPGKRAVGFDLAFLRDD
jgi:hypothetical protein